MNRRVVVTGMGAITPIGLSVEEFWSVIRKQEVGIAGNAGQVNYSASKAGIIGITKSAARELGSRGITVNAIAPGYIDTDMTQGLSDSVKEKVLEQIPLRKMGTTQDIAQMVVFLASEKGSYITGQIISIDGGMNI